MTESSNAKTVRKSLKERKEKNLWTLKSDRIEWLKRRKKDGWKPPFSNRERGLFKGLRDMAKKEIKDLTIMAENLPEEQCAQIFNSETLEPLIQAVLTTYGEDERDLVVKNQRVFGIATILLNKINQAGAKGLIRGPFDTMLMTSRESYDYSQVIPIINQFYDVMRRGKKKIKKKGKS